jgi:hypothetical protein
MSRLARFCALALAELRRARLAEQRYDALRGRAEMP